MKHTLLGSLLCAVFILVINNIVAQEEYLISQGGTITTCNGVLYDSGGPTSNYGNSEDYTITIFANDSYSNVYLYFEEFNLESATFDYITIYDGPNTSFPALVQNMGSTNLLNEEVISSGNSLTINMHTDGSVSYDGFKAIISCGYDCQDYSIDITDFSPWFTNVDSAFIDICPGEEVSFEVSCDFPNNNANYVQNSVNLFYSWEFLSANASETVEGYGLFNYSHQFNNSGGYYVKLKTTDTNGCEAIFDGNIIVRTALRPDFTNIIMDEGVCLGEPLVLNGSFVQDTFEYGSSLVNNYPMCFEDIVGVYQESCFSFNSPSKSSVINSVDDIISVCMNMEHSYLGDLDIMLVCPNGQSIVLFEQACSSTYFGEPNQSDDCEPGIGYDYCWTNGASSMISENCNSGSSLPSGNYLPVESFAGLVGCPVDGTWCIRFIDNLGLDDGNVFNTSIELADGFESSNMWSYTNTCDTSEDSPDILWTGYGVQSPVGDTTFALVVDPGDYVYTFSVTDDWECTHDTSFNVTVYDFEDPFCSEFCDENQILTNPSDTINDGSGDEYPSQNDSDCSWLIESGTKSDNVIFMRWHYFDLFPNDYLYIYDGASQFAPLLGEFTYGSTLPGSIVSSGNQVYLKYITDSYYRSPGWSLIYETVTVGKEFEHKKELFIYPNPVADQLCLHGITETVDVYICDISGKLYRQIAGFNSGNIDVSELASGVYFAKINGEYETRVIKFVKN
ncbi:MAG: T9SS type A sorting domain-containing protein [Bacteroidales bacterium]|nr:T9SS type A sorting domain-containing protein [Bacteroidales bacterium]